MNDTNKSFEQLFLESENARKEKLEKAGKHKCIKTCIGAISRIEGKNGKMLKRPVVLMRFYECKICGKEMK